ncbi:MAG: 3-phosphoshikimate 1-carboxyvinyltransferase [Fimbriiglobus sp.]
MIYPKQYAVQPVTRPVDFTLRVPGSKSLTNRAFVLAALAEHQCTLTGALESEDTEMMAECLRRLGWQVDANWPEHRVTVTRPPGSKIIPNDSADLFVGNSGTTIRFLTAMLALGHGSYRLDGIPRMRERPIQDLLDALQELGTDAISESSTGCPPVRITARGLSGGAVRIKADTSSQYLSGLLLAVPFGQGDTVVAISSGLVSEPYITMTVALCRQFGLILDEVGPGRYVIPGRQSHDRREFAIEPDASSASYFFALAAITGGRATLTGLTRKSLQGDVGFVDALVQMGCELTESVDGLTIRGGKLHGIEIDMNAISDTVMTLAAVAVFAEGPTTITNVGHIRHKETDRLAAIATELRKFGITVEEFADGLKITPTADLHGATVDTYNDHRMAMSLALIGTRIPGVVVNDPGCVVKTYPTYWQDLEATTR